jgi:hypothetical protein
MNEASPLPVEEHDIPAITDQVPAEVGNDPTTESSDLSTEPVIHDIARLVLNLSKSTEVTSNPSIIEVDIEPLDIGDPVEVIGLIERQHFVKIAPEFSDQVEDETRVNKFRYSKRTSSMGNDEPVEGSVVELTEHEGLVALQKYLRDYIDSQIRNGKGDGDTSLVAKGILDNLTFIGKKEYLEASKGLAELWKSFLDEDPKRQLCVPLQISRSRGRRKSDLALFEQIISSFTDEELENYSGRIVTDLKDISSTPEGTKIILLDDWTISGIQMKDEYLTMKENNEFVRFADCIEVNLLVASQDRLNNGLYVDREFDSDEDIFIPVKAYYMAHSSTKTIREGFEAHVTGVHSSVDYDFENAIENMNTVLISGNDLDISYMPALTNIVRSYRHADPIIEITSDGKIIRKGTV